jgi:hypothetical protein
MGVTDTIRSDAPEREETPEPAAAARARARWLGVSRPLPVDDDPDWPVAEAA